MYKSMITILCDKELLVIVDFFYASLAFFKETLLRLLNEEFYFVNKFVIIHKHVSVALEFKNQYHMLIGSHPHSSE